MSKKETKKLVAQLQSIENHPHQLSNLDKLLIERNNTKAAHEQDPKNELKAIAFEIAYNEYQEAINKKLAGRVL